jgi:hypothetical protein
VIRFNFLSFEDAALALLETIGWRVAHCPDIAPDVPASERHHYYGEVVLAWQQRVQEGDRPHTR